MAYGKDRVMKDIVKQLLAQGWRVEMCSRTHHMKCYPPNGQSMVTIPATQGNARGLANCKAELRRRGATIK